MGAESHRKISTVYSDVFTEAAAPVTVRESDLDFPCPKRLSKARTGRCLSGAGWEKEVHLPSPFCYRTAVRPDARPHGLPKLTKTQAFLSPKCKIRLLHSDSKAADCQGLKKWPVSDKAVLEAVRQHYRKEGVIPWNCCRYKNYVKYTEQVKPL